MNAIYVKRKTDRSVKLAVTTLFFVPILFSPLLVDTARAQSSNLVGNGTLEIENPPGSPQGFTKGRWGTNTAVFSYPVSGVSGSKAAKVALTSRTSGDAKWAFASVPVTPGHTYEYADQYIANVATVLTAEFQTASGLQYDDLETVPPASVFTGTTAQFTAPAGATSVRVFHLINQVGNLTIDNVSLRDVTPSGNLIRNPSVEQVGSSGNPLNWNKGKWGTNTTQFAYPVAGYDGTKAMRVSMSTRTSGDAKWFFDDVAVTPGTTYEFTDRSRSDVQTFVTVQYRHSNGTVSYQDIGTVPAGSSWKLFTGSFTVPSGVSAVSVFHGLNRVGFLETDAFTLRVRSAGDPTLFDRGYVTLTFDDGYRSAYDTVFPMLENAGFSSTHFIVTERMAAGDFPGFIKVSEILEMQSGGHEIGAHTRSHPDLTQIPLSQARTEIEGSRTDLLNIGVTPAAVFAYPFGAYNASVQSLVRNAGFSAARSSDGGFNKRNSDKFALQRKLMDSSVTLAEVKADIDQAVRDKTWLILLFHDVVPSGGTSFAVTPEFLAEVVNYLEQKNVTPITVSQGVSRMQ